MSYRDPGTVITAAPPAPHRRPLGFYFAVAFGVIVFLILVSLGIYLGKMWTALQPPLDKATVLKSMAGIPVIDDAVFDETQTKIQLRVVLPTLRDRPDGWSASTVAYRTFTEPEGVMAWYDQKLSAKNYTVDNEADEATAPTVTFEHRYDRDNEVILVHAQRAPNKEDTSLVVTRFSSNK